MSSSWLSRRHHILALALVALAGHFAITLLYLTPANPLKASLEGVVDGYMNPWFDQRWELFAPSPVNSSRYLLVACKTRDGEAEPPWQDITQPLLAAKYAYRVTPADRLHRAVQASTSLLFGTPRPVVDKMRSKADEFKQELERIDAADADRFVMGQRLVVRVASAHCDQLHGAGRTVAVRARVIFRELPSFSKRLEDERQGEIKIFDLEWQDHQSVAQL